MLTQPPPLVQALIQEANVGMNNPAARDLALQAAFHALQHLRVETTPDEITVLIQQVTGDNGPATAFALTLIGTILVGAQKGDLKLPGPLTTERPSPPTKRKSHRHR